MTVTNIGAKQEHMNWLQLLTLLFVTNIAFNKVKRLPCYGVLMF